MVWSFFCYSLFKDYRVKKIIKAVESNIYDLLGREAVQGRPIPFKIFVGTLVLGVTFFVLINLIQLVL